MKKKTKKMNRNGIRKTENRKKRGLRKGSKNKRMQDLVREEQEGFYNGDTQIEQKWEQSEIRKRNRVETKTETEQQRQE